MVICIGSLVVTESPTRFEPKSVASPWEGISADFGVIAGVAVFSPRIESLHSREPYHFDLHRFVKEPIDYKDQYTPQRQVCQYPP
jgi:hypothetical protein